MAVAAHDVTLLHFLPNLVDRHTLVHHIAHRMLLLSWVTVMELEYPPISLPASYTGVVLHVLPCELPSFLPSLVLA